MSKLDLMICINGTFEEEKALINKENDEILCKGDYYHDKIDEKIEGFIKGLNYCGYEVIVNEETINPDNELFDSLEFWNENYDDECDYDEDVIQ